MPNALLFVEPSICSERVCPYTSISPHSVLFTLTPLSSRYVSPLFTLYSNSPFVFTQNAILSPCRAHSSGIAPTQNPGRPFRSGQAKGGRESGFMQEGQ